MKTNLILGLAATSVFLSGCELGEYIEDSFAPPKQNTAPVPIVTDEVTETEDTTTAVVVRPVTQAAAPTRQRTRLEFEGPADSSGPSSSGDDSNDSGSSGVDAGGSESIGGGATTLGGPGAVTF